MWERKRERERERERERQRQRQKRKRLKEERCKEILVLIDKRCERLTRDLLTHRLYMNFLLYLKCSCIANVGIHNVQNISDHLVDWSQIIIKTKENERKICR